MTTKPEPDQAHKQRRTARAVWLARLPEDRSTADASHHARRLEAHAEAARGGAKVVGEFVYAAAYEDRLPDHVWSEVLDFLRHLEASVLVVLRTDEVAGVPGALLTRATSLKNAGVRLLIRSLDHSDASADQARKEAA